MRAVQLLLLSGGRSGRRLGVRGLSAESAVTVRLPALGFLSRTRDRLLRLLEGAERTLVLADRSALRLLRAGRLPSPLLRRVRVVVAASDGSVQTVAGTALAAAHRPPGRSAHRRLGSLLDRELARLRTEGEAAIRARLSRPARIVLVSPPFSGHLHPLLGVAHALRERGCRVLVCCTRDRREQIEGEGLEFLPLLAGREERVQALAGVNRRGLRALPRTLRDLRRALRLMEAMVEELVAGLGDAVPDALVADMTLPLAGAAAERLGCPWVTAHPSPCVIETPDGPPCSFGGLGPARSGPERLRESVLRVWGRLVKGVFFHLVVGRQPFLVRFPGARRADGSECFYSPSRILCLGDREFEFARRWPRSVRFTGPVAYTPRDPLAGTGASAALRRGRRPLVVCTFGTHLPHVKRQLPVLLRRAAAMAPEADIVLASGRPRPIEGFDGFGPDRERENLRLVPCLDYARLDEADLVVHHGGAGACWAALASGRRQIVVPADYDQPDNAERLARRGLAVRLRTLAQLPGAIRSALDSMIDGPDPAAAARLAWQRRLRAVDGAGRAAEQILLDMGR